MTVIAEQSQTKPSADARVIAAVDQVVDVLSLKHAGRVQLLAFIDELAVPLAKLPLVRFYAATTKSGINWRATYRVKGYKLRTERLGIKAKLAYQRAQRVSEILQQVKAGLMKSVDAHRILYVDNMPMETHVQAFERSLRSKGNVDRYNTTTMTRLRRCIDMGGFDRIGQISTDGLPDLIEQLRVFVDPKMKTTPSESTINDYLATLRQFTKWATPKLLPIDPLVNSGGVKVTTKKDRRDLLVEEVGLIVGAALRSTAGFEMKGKDRAMLYLAAYGTGLRANELRQLEISWLNFDAQPQPYIALPEGIQKKTGRAKNLKHPIPSWLAAEWRRWLNGRTKGLVWAKLPKNTAEMFNRDRSDARTTWLDTSPDAETRAQRDKSDFLARKTTDGSLVFHSHRHSFATSALASLDLKTAQMLTRHMTTAMLTDQYGHSRQVHAAVGVEKAIRNPMTEAEKR